ncbi:MAG: hypothetical protein JNL04_05235 [Rhodospirillaceae bacterium]|nr:hypothetical protein [Rhodospirillaceae bacterium]
MSRTRPFADPAVKAAFAAYPRGVRADLLALRALIFEAATHPAIGPCQTTLAQRFRETYPGLSDIDGKRALLFAHGAKLPRDKLKHCIQMGLTYYVRLAA